MGGRARHTFEMFAGALTALPLALGDVPSLHEVSIGQRRIGRPAPEDWLVGIPSVGNERPVRLSGMLGRVGSKAVYAYDFGDTWEHGSRPGETASRRSEHDVSDLRGWSARVSPEDCGGIPGFYDFVEALNDPTHERHEELVDWIGDFDPQAFSVDKVNRVPTPARRRRKAPLG